MTPTFDYGRLSEGERLLVLGHRDAIQSEPSAYEIGTRLLAVKAVLGHGPFTDWLAAEFAWSERTARNFMAVAKAFKTADSAVLKNSDDYAQVALASAPESARQEAERRADAGERITHAAAKEIVARHRRGPVPGAAVAPDAPDAYEDAGPPAEWAEVLALPPAPTVSELVRGDLSDWREARRWGCAVVRECIHATADADVRRALVALHEYLGTPPPASAAEWVERARESARVEAALRSAGKRSGLGNWV